MYHLIYEPIWVIFEGTYKMTLTKMVQFLGFRRKGWKVSVKRVEYVLCKGVYYLLEVVKILIRVPRDLYTSYKISYHLLLWPLLVMISRDVVLYFWSRDWSHIPLRKHDPILILIKSNKSRWGTEHGTGQLIGQLKHWSWFFGSQAEKIEIFRIF